MDLSKKAYYEPLNRVGWKPVSYKDIASCLMENGVKQMYHAIVNEADIQLMFSIPNLKTNQLPTNIFMLLYNTKRERI